MIWDVFPFFNELDLLDIRLHVHAPYVDRFIIVEAHCTHSGNPKPLYFAENRHLFEQFQNRIIHVVCDYEGRDARANEVIQRNAALAAMKDYRDEDVIIHSDLDEIVDFSTMPLIPAGIFQLEQKMYHYYLNLLRGGWDFAKIFTGGEFREMGSNFNTMRHYRAHHDWSQQPIIKNAGWHFSYMGGPVKVKEKIEAYIHQEFNQPHLTDLAAITERIHKHEDVLCRGAGENWWTRKVEINEENHPKYLVDNQEKFSHLILK